MIRLRDSSLFSLFLETPVVLSVEPKYESIGSSPVIEECGLMEIHNQEYSNGQPDVTDSSAHRDAFTDAS
jgi:hypothetical protein